MKKLVSLLLITAMLLSVLPLALAASAPEDPYADQFIDLRGEWNFKVYRKYDQMFQYLPYGMCNVSWSDDALAAVPTSDVYGAWETVSGPAADYATGGLLQMYRQGTDEDVRDRLTDNELFPKWSEAWFCKTITVPAGFAREGTATLLLGVIDDMDVVYVNGVPVGQSGFKKADGAPADPAAAPALGGFDMAGDFQFEKSYWEVSRQYTFDASILKEGDNELCVRLFNNNSFGGFYDRTLALAASRECVNYLKGLPTEKLTDTAIYEAYLAAQTAALVAEDIDAFAATLCDHFANNELDKAGLVAQVKGIMDAYDDIQAEYADYAYYAYNGKVVFFGSRVITGVKDGERVTITADPECILYVEVIDGVALGCGNHSHCYTVTYTSSLEAMGGKELVYSVYLPPSYYDTDKAYPVVYLLHGINSTGDSFVNVDKIEARMNEWIAQGAIEEMIVVMPNSGKSSFYLDTDAPDGVGDGAGPWASHIYVDILSQIDTNYRTLAQKEFRGMSGISMGGAGVLNVGLAHTDIYTSFASHMGAVGGYQAAVDAIPADVLPTLSFYLDCGEQDQMVNPADTKAAGEYLQSLNAKVFWELRDGAHNSAFYMAGMPNSMKTHSDHFVVNGLLDIWAK